MSFQQSCTTCIVVVEIGIFIIYFLELSTHIYCICVHFKYINYTKKQTNKQTNNLCLKFKFVLLVTFVQKKCIGCVEFYK